MVDYFALIAPTIESLAKSTVEERRQVYDRLIKMLEAQLRSADPPRSEIDILRERIDLEAAIRRVERRIQAGQISVGSPTGAAEPKASAEKADDGSSKSGETSGQFGAPGADRNETSGRPIAQKPDLSGSVAERAPPQLPQHHLARPPEPVRPPTPTPPDPAGERPAGWASTVPQGASLGAFAERTAALSPRVRPETETPMSAVGSAPIAPEAIPAGPPRRSTSGLDVSTSAATRASQAPQSTLPIAPGPPRPASSTRNEPDPAQPLYGQRDGESRMAASRLRDLPSAFRSMPGALASQRSAARQADVVREAAALRPQSVPPVDAGPGISPNSRTSGIENAAQPYTADEQVKDGAGSQPTGRFREPNSEISASDLARPTVSIGQRARVSMLPIRGFGSWQRLAIISACVVAILGGIAMTAYLLRDDPAEFKSASGKYAASEKPQAEEKIADRLPTQESGQNVNSAKAPTLANGSQQAGNSAQPNVSAPIPDANGVLTQKAMLLMEPTDQSAPPQPLNGRVTWKLETLKSVVDNASEIGSRATIEIPDVGLTAAFVFRRNRDPQSANSHMIEVTFTLGDNNATGKVRDIRVPELRTDETARGTALSGVPVPVTENVFLIGLNALPSEMQKNLDLLRSQNWFAMPLRFANGKRGILMFEKGKTGERVMEDAMQAWKAN